MGVQSEQPSAKKTSTEQRVAVNDVDQVEDTDVEVRTEKHENSNYSKPRDSKPENKHFGNCEPEGQL
jgi:hypothetical protein